MPTLSKRPYSQMSCSRALVLMAMVNRTCATRSWGSRRRPQRRPGQARPPDQVCTPHVPPETPSTPHPCPLRSDARAEGGSGGQGSCWGLGTAASTLSDAIMKMVIASTGIELNCAPGTVFSSPNLLTILVLTIIL